MAFFFWGIIAVVFGVIWLGTLLAFIASRFSHSKIVRGLGFFPFAALTAGAVWFVFSLYYFSTPPQVFKNSFGFIPTNDVREIKSQFWYFGDSGTTYLKFKANSQTIKRIVAIGLMEQPHNQSDSCAFVGGEVPDWWTPDSKAATHIYAKSNRMHDFASEEEILCYDKNTQQAYYYFQGID